VTDISRDDWRRKKCEELKETKRKGKSDLMYALIKQLAGQCKSRCRCNAIKKIEWDLT